MVRFDRADDVGAPLLGRTSWFDAERGHAAPKSELLIGGSDCVGYFPICWRIDHPDMHALGELSQAGAESRIDDYRHRVWQFGHFMWSGLTLTN
jgi:hypothetical protein